MAGRRRSQVEGWATERERGGKSGEGKSYESVPSLSLPSFSLPFFGCRLVNLIPRRLSNRGGGGGGFAKVDPGRETGKSFLVCIVEKYIIENSYIFGNSSQKPMLLQIDDFLATGLGPLGYGATNTEELLYSTYKRCERLPPM